MFFGSLHVPNRMKLAAVIHPGRTRLKSREPDPRAIWNLPIIRTITPWRLPWYYFFITVVKPVGCGRET
jgi:hypothetical protein